MRIAIIDPSLFTWPYDSELAKGLRNNGHEVILYGKQLGESEPGKGAVYYRELFYPGFNSPRIKSLPNPVFLALKGLMHPISMMRLLRELRRFRPDVIHFQWVPLPLADRFFISLFQRIAPVILTVHDSMPFNNNPRSKLQRFGATSIMCCFDRLIVHTEQARKRVISYGVAKKRIARIPHGILSSDASDISISLPEMRSDDKIVLLLFGKLKPYKGADILIRAVASMPLSARARCLVRIIGKPYMDVGELYDLAKELGISENFIWDLRFVDEKEMPGIFSQADIMVMPYREIDASGVLMVALAMGRPIVASRIGLFAEMLEDGKHGYLVTPERPDELGKALALLIEDDALRLKLGNEVVELKKSIPDWSAIASMTEALYIQAIKDKQIAG